ncbi:MULTISPECIES: MarR family winged helix-turn-helix transcriptional regulator [Sulfitobacter]|uniref:MarR family winged helix-turn-helix transcriptional regulator n=1 Tax=Sulfitobacter TaxID=60136 RepID=UPI001E4D5130|nr:MULTISPECIES: MarR family transcriptional regulator [unclassified Sulfitobacter]
MTDTPPSGAENAPLDRMGLDNFAPYLMNRIMGRYNAALSAEMAALGLTTPQMRSLAVLSVTDGILIRELAVYAVVQQSTLSRALDALVRDGLVRRETDANDSRATRVYLTDQGREAYARLWPHMAQAYEAMFKGIGTEEKAAFVATLQTMLRNIRKHDF